MPDPFAQGPEAQWPEAVRPAAEIVAASAFPSVLCHGPDALAWYNDAFRAQFGDRPQDEPVIEILRTPVRQVYATGTTMFAEDRPVGSSFWTYSCVPVRDSGGAVLGVMVTVYDTTHRVLTERRAKALADLAEVIWTSGSSQQVLTTAVTVLSRGSADIAFALMYGCEGHEPHLVATCGLVGDPPAELTRIAWDGPLRLAAAADRDTPIVVPAPAGLTLIGPGPASRAVTAVIRDSGTHEPVAAIVLGVYDLTVVDEAFLAFAYSVTVRITLALLAASAIQRRERLEALTELDRAKTEFVADISHELRGPLTLIAGPLTETLADPTLPARHRERLAIAGRSVARLRRLVDDLLDFLRMDRGRVSAEPVDTDLPQLTKGLAESFRYAMERAGLDFVVDVQSLPRPAAVDRDMWEKIVTNLLSNAVKYTLAGQVTLSLDGTEEEIVLQVRDTGVGVPAEQQPLLFQRFYRVRSSEGRTQEGSGIGLAMVEELAGLHGGSVSVYSVHGEGTTFTVRLPYGSPTGVVDDSEPTHNRYVDEVLSWLPGDAVTESTTGSASVLVVDDNADMLAYLAGLLEPNYRVRSAINGKQALDLIAESIPDLVLTDVVMPVLNGLELLSALRDDPRTALVPVIMLTARAGEVPTTEGMRSGADDYLAKPFSSVELLARVRAHLELARLRNQETTWRRALTDSLQDALVIFTEDGTLLEANEAFGQLVGTDVTRCPMPPPHPWSPAEERGLVSALSSSGRDDRNRIPLRHADGHIVWVEGMFSSLRDPDTGGRIHVGTLRDITEDRLGEQRQAALTRLSTSLAQAGDSTQVINAGLTELRGLLATDNVVAVTDDLTVLAGPPLTSQTRQGVIATLRGATTRVETDSTDRVTGIGMKLEPGLCVWGVPGRRLSHADRAQFQLLCGVMSQSLSRARSSDAQRDVALALQRSILGPEDLPPGFAVRYEPSVRPLEVGGDWYDVVRLSGSGVGVVVGDCIGSGLTAATIMGQLRSACRALLLQAKGPAEVLTALDDFAASIPGATCTTVFCGIVDGDTLRYSTAGHPPGIVVSDGTGSLLDQATSVPLAVRTRTPRPEAAVELAAGSTVVLYTDGLVERRGEPITKGLDRAVAAVVDSQALTEQQLADSLMYTMVPGTQDDDVALLVYRHRDPRSFEIEIPADPTALAPARQAFKEWLSQASIHPNDVEAIIIAADEAQANAIEHGYRGQADNAATTLHAYLNGDRLSVVIRDHGTWQEPTRDTTYRGRGLMFMRRLMDGMEIDGTSTGTEVRLTKRVRIVR